ncbi:MAG TPA: ABC transporter ATP-binding protein [Erysipelothrix sp.]
MEHKKSNIKTMVALLTYLKPLKKVMVLAVIFGTLGHLSATMIPYLAIKAAIQKKVTIKIVVFVLSLGILRAIFRYLEQLLNHHIAFKILAEIRHHVFNQLQRLAPSKLEEKNQGDLIAMITSDIELIEVFYAHTISPILIFVFYLIVILLLQSAISVAAVLITLLSHSFIVYFIPRFAHRHAQEKGDIIRRQSGLLSADMLSGIYGIFSLSQFSMKASYQKKLENESEKLTNQQFVLRKNQGFSLSLVDLSIFTFALLLIFKTKVLSIEASVLALVLYLSSFGPSIALANLGFDLQETLASARRITDLLAEEPLIKEQVDAVDIGDFQHLVFSKVSFSYNEDLILDDISFNLNNNEILGIKGRSGEGKSTILKLMMRFWDVKRGKILINGLDIKELSLSSLRSTISYMGQDPLLFEDTIAYNIGFNDPRYDQKAIEKAAKKAAIHELIISLEDGYQTKLATLGDSLSMGEKQRIALARMFLFDHDVLLFDEPTSNLDYYNESLILKSIRDHCKDKTVVIVSHRESTLRICDRILNLEHGQLKECAC